MLLYTKVLFLNIEIQKDNPKLSVYDCINFVVSKKYNALLATGDKRLREYALKEGVEVIRTIYIIKMLYKKEVIMNKQDRIKELIEILNRASRAYYQEAREIMTNFEYDALYDELVELEKEIVGKCQNYACISFAALDAKPNGFKQQGVFGIHVKSVNSYNNSFELLVKDLKNYKKNHYIFYCFDLYHIQYCIVLMVQYLSFFH